MKLQLTILLVALAGASARLTPEQLRARKLQDEPTAAPAEGDGEGGGDGDGEGSGEDGDGADTCFSAMNTVEVQGKGMITMDSLEIGDYVRSGKDFSRVFSFGHLDSDLEAEFLQIYTVGSDAPLELTNNHMLFRNDKAVRAKEVSVGDMLGDNKVTDIVRTKRTGVYAPITYDGTIVVSGIKSSCYVQMMDLAPVDQNNFIHMFYSVHRAACSVNFGWCEEETYTNGFSDYSNWAIQLYSYCNQFSAAGQWFMSALMILIAPIWCTAEHFLVSPILSLMAVGFLIYKSQTKKSKSA